MFGFGPMRRLPRKDRSLLLIPARRGQALWNELLLSARPVLTAALCFSAAINMLYLAPTLYMMQVYDRVLQTGGLQTLVFVSLILLAHFSGASPNSTYIPAHIENGKFVPGVEK